MSTNLRGTDTAPVRAPDEPAVIRRLPPGVEYSYVKLIILDPPSPLYIAPWLSTDTDDSIWSLFRGKTFRALDRALRLREQRAAVPDPKVDQRQFPYTQMLRHFWVQHFLAAVRQCDSNRQTRWLTIRIVNQPSGTGQAPKIVARAWVLEVWGPGRPTPRLLNRSVVPPAVPPWGDERVPYYDPQLIDGITAAVLRQHFPEVLRQRIGWGWRSERRHPSGWPMLLRRAIPTLYDYLRPFYAARRYRKSLTSPTRGDYPTQLLQDIVDILQLELPHLTTDLTVERVQAAVQRHIRRAAPKRSMGADLFALSPRTETR
jgi:hypothetical protein